MIQKSNRSAKTLERGVTATKDEDRPARGERISSMLSVFHFFASESTTSSPRKRTAVAFALAIFSMLFVTACANDPTPMGSRLMVSTPFAEFYKHGPAQDVGFAQTTFANQQMAEYTGPDFQLPKGATVTLLKREPGYSKVVTDNGVAGYVANEKLRPAPVVAHSAPTEMRTDRTFHQQRTRVIPPSRRNQEQLDLSDIPLPLPS